MEKEPKTIRGGCLCGAIRYEGIGEPYNVTHCHCEDCRKSAGAPFATWASFRRAISIYQGQTARNCVGRARPLVLRDVRQRADFHEPIRR